MLYTPVALELARRCPFLSAGGEEERPETAESTLVRCSTVSADMIAGGRLWKRFNEVKVLLLI